MRKKPFCFMALGGAQSVGASCYYLKLGEANLLLDCGTGLRGDVVCKPDFQPLLTSPFLQGLGQLDQVVISHAHLDHVGYLPELLGQTGETPVYMTEMTSLLAQHQLFGRGGNRGWAEDRMLRQTVKTGYFREYDFGNHRAYFLPAGHIPGAMMALFECGGRRILYTGDYSLEETPLTPGCILPEEADVDVLILCGLHAKHPWYRKKEGALDGIARRVFCALRAGRPVYCKVRQLSKGVELLKVLNGWNARPGNGFRIYLEETVLEIVRRLERVSVPVFGENNYSAARLWGGRREAGDPAPGPHIVIGSGLESRLPSCYERVNADFALHEDFDGLLRTIRRLNPRQAVVVHCEAARNKGDFTIEQELMRDGGCRTQFIFAREGQCYVL